MTFLLSTVFCEENAVSVKREQWKLAYIAKPRKRLLRREHRFRKARAMEARLHCQAKETSFSKRKTFVSDMSKYSLPPTARLPDLSSVLSPSHNPTPLYIEPFKSIFRTHFSHFFFCNLSHSKKHIHLSTFHISTFNVLHL